MLNAVVANKRQAIMALFRLQSMGMNEDQILNMAQQMRLHDPVQLGTASVIRNFELYDPYHPYHPYIILDPTSVGKDCKGSKDGVI
jgi:hypothetical protein